MARTHARSPSPGANQSILKRLKIDGAAPGADQAILKDPTPHFAQDLFNPNTVHRLHKSYAESEPYKYALVEKLFQDDLLEKVKDECLSELHFTEKETDIYRVRPNHFFPDDSFL